MSPETECHFNGQRITVKNGTRLEDVIISQGYEGQKFAVAINGEFVPRSKYISTPVSSDDSIDIVMPVFGG